MLSFVLPLQIGEGCNRGGIPSTCSPATGRTGFERIRWVFRIFSAFDSGDGVAARRGQVGERRRASV
ncbi:hypothetical protein SAY86_014090 [Trapa natans]|uniref:Uncharacterized protein n=1 Tax=Trapa natans TaxID=22666 RepID=A0AAN7KYH8_TRANT|nr:hypothetical protein SAY86_014090 [Trapa natans]